MILVNEENGTTIWVVALLACLVRLGVYASLVWRQRTVIENAPWLVSVVLHLALLACHDQCDTWIDASYYLTMWCTLDFMYSLSNREVSLLLKHDTDAMRRIIEEQHSSQTQWLFVQATGVLIVSVVQLLQATQQLWIGTVCRWAFFVAVLFYVAMRDHQLQTSIDELKPMYKAMRVAIRWLVLFTPGLLLLVYSATIEMFPVDRPSLLVYAVLLTMNDVALWRRQRRVSGVLQELHQRLDLSTPDDAEALVLHTLYTRQQWWYKMARKLDASQEEAIKYICSRRIYPLYSEAVYPRRRMQQWCNPSMYTSFCALEPSWKVDITPAELLLFLIETRTAVPTAVSTSSKSLRRSTCIEQNERDNKHHSSENDGMIALTHIPSDSAESSNVYSPASVSTTTYIAILPTLCIIPHQPLPQLFFRSEDWIWDQSTVIEPNADVETVIQHLISLLHTLAISTHHTCEGACLREIHTALSELPYGILQHLPFVIRQYMRYRMRSILMHTSPTTSMFDLIHRYRTPAVLQQALLLTSNARDLPIVSLSNEPSSPQNEQIHIDRLQEPESDTIDRQSRVLEHVLLYEIQQDDHRSFASESACVAPARHLPANCCVDKILSHAFVVDDDDDDAVDAWRTRMEVCLQQPESHLVGCVHHLHTVWMGWSGYTQITIACPGFRIPLCRLVDIWLQQQPSLADVLTPTQSTSLSINKNDDDEEDDSDDDEEEEEEEEEEDNNNGVMQRKDDVDDGSKDKTAATIPLHTSISLHWLRHAYEPHSMPVHVPSVSVRRHRWVKTIVALFRWFSIVYRHQTCTPDAIQKRLDCQSDHGLPSIHACWSLVTYDIPPHTTTFSLARLRLCLWREHVRGITIRLWYEWTPSLLEKQHASVWNELYQELMRELAYLPIDLLQGNTQPSHESILVVKDVLEATYCNRFNRHDHTLWILALWSIWYLHRWTAQPLARLWQSALTAEERRRIDGNAVSIRSIEQKKFIAEQLAATSIHSVPPLFIYNPWSRKGWHLHWRRMRQAKCAQQFAVQFDCDTQWYS